MERAAIRKGVLLLASLLLSGLAFAGPVGPPAGSSLSPDDVILNKSTAQPNKQFNVSQASISTMTAVTINAQVVKIGGVNVSTSITSGTSVYPATATASFPLGLTAGTGSFSGAVTGTSVTITGLLSGQVIHGSSAVITGTVSGSNLSGTNTGDVTIGTANGLSASGQALSMTTASSVSTGSLRAVDFNTFNNKLSTNGNGSSLTGLTKTQVGLSNVQNVDQTDASNLTSGQVDPTLLGTGTPTSGKYVRGDGAWTTLNSTAVGLGQVTNNAQVKKTDYTQKGGFLVGIGTGGVYAVQAPGADGMLLQANSAYPTGLNYVPAQSAFTMYPATSTVFLTKGAVVSTLTVSGTSVFNGTNTYNNTQTFNGASTFSGSAVLNGTSTINGPTTINGDIAVNGATTFNGDVTTFGTDQHFATGTYVGNPLYFANTAGVNARIPGARFTTDLGNIRYGAIEGEEETDAAQIGLDFYTMNGDSNGIIKKLRIHPEGYVEQYLSGVTNIWNGNQTYNGWETHNATGTFQANQVFNGTNTHTGAETFGATVTSNGSAIFNGPATFNGGVTLSSVTLPIINTSTINVSKAVVWPDGYAQKANSGFVHVEDFGAVADGTSDNYPAITAAISYATTTWKNATIIFSGGVYGINHQITIPSNVTFQGSGMGATTIYGLGTFPSGQDMLHCGPDFFHNYSDPAVGAGHFITIRDLKIDGTNGSAFSYGIAAQGVDYFTADHVFISSSSKYGIDIEGSTTTYSESPMVLHCYFYNCGRSGGADTIGGGYNKGARYLYNTFEKCNGTAIDNVGVKNALWQGNRTINPVAAGNGGIWSDFGFENGSIVDNYLTSATIHVYGFLGSNLLGSPVNVLIQGNNLYYPTSSAILVSPANQSSSSSFTATGIRVLDNYIQYAYDSGIVVGDAPGAVIANNQIDYWGLVDNTGAAINYGSGLNPSVISSSGVISGNTGRVGNSAKWYLENASAGQLPNNEVFGNNFQGGTYTLLTSSHDVINYPQGYQRFIGANVANTVIGGTRYSTDGTDSRWAAMQGFEGSDAATIGINVYTMNGDSPGIEKRFVFNPDGSLAQQPLTASIGPNIWTAPELHSNTYETHAGSQTFSASPISMTPYSPGVMHIVATSSNVTTALVSLSTETTGNYVAIANVNGSMIGGTSGSAGASLTLGVNSSSGTLQGNTFNGASQLVQLNSSTQLPAISGVNLTNLNGSNVASGTVGSARLPADVVYNDVNTTFTSSNTFSGANTVSSETVTSATITNLKPGGLTTSRVPYYNGTKLVDSSNLTFDGTTLGAGAFTATNVTNSALTSGRVTYAGASGLLSDSSVFTFNGSTLALTGGNWMGFQAQGSNNTPIGSFYAASDVARHEMIQAWREGDAATLSWRFYVYNGDSSAISEALRLLSDTSVRMPKYGVGTATFDSSGNITSVSDERLKNIQGPFKRGLKDLLGIRPIIYHWNEKSHLNMDDVNAGFSAQNVKESIPEAVAKNKDGYYSLSDRPIIAALVNAVNELSAQVTDLKKQVETLEKSKEK